MAFLRPRSFAAAPAPRRAAVLVRGAMLALAATAFGAAASAHAAPPASAAVKVYGIAAGPLSPALSSFAGSAGVNFSSDPALTAGLLTRGLQGSVSVAEGFARLLEGTSLQAVPQGADVFVLRKSAPAASAAQALAPVTVTAQGLRATTEGAGSYTSGTMNTAMRLDLSVRDTPQSVSVVTRQLMDDMGMTRLDQVLEQTTGVIVGKSDSERTNFSARGFSIDNSQIDGMPRGQNAPLSDTILYDRVEVVRGATGLMGGTGDPSATVNMVRKRPTRAFQGGAGLVLERWNGRRTEVDVSGPLSAGGGVRARAALAHESRDSYMDFYHDRKWVGMVIVEADLAPATLLTAGIDFQHNKPNGSTWGAVPYWNADGSLANLPRNFSLGTPWNSWANEQETVFASLDHQFANGWKVHAGYARTNSRNNTTLAYGGDGYPDTKTGGGMVLWTGVWGEGKYVTDNVDLYASGPFQLLGRRHTLIAGFNGSNQTYTAVGGDAKIDYEKEIPDYRLWTGNIPRPVFVPDGSRTEAVTRLGGAYLAARFSLADPLHVIVGARLSNYNTYTRQYNKAGVHTETTDRVEARNEVTPYVGVVYDLNDRYSAYASYTTLFTPQTSKDKNGQFLKPATGSNAELGVKGEFFDGKLNASSAVFLVKKKNLAELDQSVPAGFKLPDGGSAYVANADGITAKGVEFEVSGQLTAAWNLSGGYTYLHAAEADGRRAVPDQPRHLLRLSSAYRFGGALQGWRAGAGLTTQSATYGDSWFGRPPHHTKPARVGQGSYTLVSLMAGYDVSPRVSVQLNVSNLFDREYYRNVGFYDSVFWGEPRRISASLRTTF
ncbi:TonB-dependent siderophore receptor [Janthinobacterium fluminis]|uniref:TonB-dependent siderophore receptor n=1 Tax=Janthinobacterium fluminis TaxID=2987524 RepID=A0ABT5JYN6_9BURK|nr:TonB-dependent receptor [Janthinobacterium fluminis]MDC8757833.1 TonB-dependent siderophore receptor [Janthinobacterium fluminis]